MELFNSCSQVELQRFIELNNKFDIPSGHITTIRTKSSGRINKTVMPVMNHEGAGFKKYVLQRINTHVFKEPNELMDNIVAVTNHLRDKGFVTLHPYVVKNPQKDVSPYLFYDEVLDEHWRLYDFIESDVKDSVETELDMYHLGEAMGQLSMALNDFDATRLVETIPGFHNTSRRYSRFVNTFTSSDKVARCKTCREEIDFIVERREKVGIIVNALRDGKIPCRVSHNDPKLNNVLFDKSTGKVLCLVDLDTVMPGTILYDFGDAARYGCNTASEEEVNLDMVCINFAYFRALTEGLLESMKEVITEEEVKLLVTSFWMMTHELAIRFLDDHIDGNHYFGVPYDGKNLERSKVQIKLEKEIEANWDYLQKIVDETCAKVGIKF